MSELERKSRGFKTGHGGSREGAGRPPGSRNRRTKEVEAATKEAAVAIEAALGEPFGGDAHALLMAVYKDAARPIEIRIEAAKAAIRYEKPALAAIDLTSSNEHTIYAVSNEPLSLEEWEAKFCNATGH